MNRDQIWQELKNNKETIYNEPMLDVFLKTTSDLERKHYDELPESKRKLVGANLRLEIANSSQEVDQALKDGAEFGYYTLNYAAKTGNIKAIKLLMEKAGDKYNSNKLAPNSDDWRSRLGIKFAIESAAEFGQKEMLEFLITKDTIDHAIKGAAKGNRIELVDYLLEKGADPASGLLKAAQHGKEEMAELLLSKGADNLYMAIDTAAYSGQLKMFEFLLGKDVKGNFRMVTAIKSAAKGNQFEMVEFLLKKAQKIDKFNRFRDEAFYAAAEYGQLKMVEFLIEKGAKDFDGALRASIEMDELSMAKFFVEKGATNIKQALIVAKNYGAKEIEEYLTNLLEKKSAVDRA